MATIFTCLIICLGILYKVLASPSDTCPGASTALKADHQLFPNPSGSYAIGRAVGSTLSDIGTSAYPYPITAGSGVTYKGRSLKFDGSTDAWLSLGTEVIFGGFDFSLSVWGMYNAFGSNSRIFDFQPSADSPYGVYAANTATTSQLSFDLFNSGNTQPPGAVWTLNQFSHLVLSCSFPSSCKVYFDGALVSTVAVTMSSQTYSYVSGLGKSSYSWDANLQGQVSDFRLFSRALSSDEVYAIYSGHECLSSSCAVGQYFSESSSSCESCLDYSWSGPGTYTCSCSEGYFSSGYGDGLICSTDFSFGNFSYTPSWYVQALHGVPHLNNYMQIKSDSSFNGGESNDAPEYYQSVWIFPVIISCLIAVAVALVQVFFFGHFDQYLPFKSPGPEPLSAVDETRSGIAIWTHKVEKSRRFYVILFLSTLGVLLVSLHSLFVGNYFVATGIKTFDDGLRNFETIIFNVGNQVKDLEFKLGKTNGFINDAYAACPLAAYLNNQNSVTKSPLVALQDSLGSLLSTVYFHGRYTADFRNDLVEYDVSKNWVIYTFYVIVMLLLGCFVACFFTRNTNMMRVTIATSQVMLLAFIVLGTLQFVYLIMLGDFCMSPESSLVTSIQDGIDIQESARFYSSCKGSNPMHQELADAYLKRDYLGKAIKIELRNGICNGDQNLESAYTHVSLMYPGYEYIAHELGCQVIHPIWVSSFETGLCEETVLGVFSLWLSQVVTMIALFFLSIVSSTMLLFFDEYWDISQVSIDKIPRDSEQGKLLHNDPEMLFYLDRSGTPQGKKKNIGNGNTTYSPVLQTEEKAPKDNISVVTQVPFKVGASRGAGGGGGASKGQR